MASFATNPRSFLSHTAGYVSQAPIINAEIQGEQVMQKREEDGIQKISQTINGINSLPLANLDDQNYLKQQLNNIHNSFSNISGDFADSRFTNQLGGAINSLSSDNRIRNGVQQTLSMQADRAQMEDDRKNGKYDIAHEAVFNQAANAYVNDRSGNAIYQKSYYTPIDITGKLNDALKSLGSQETVEENPFYFDKYSGQWRIANSMTKTTRKGPSPDLLNNAMNLIMSDPDVQNEMRIQGQYRFMGYSPEQILQTIKNQDQILVDATNAQKDDLRKALALKNDITPQEAAAKLDAINKNYAASRKPLEQMYNLALQNPDAAKTAIQEQMMRTNYLSVYGYQWEHPSVEHVVNPEKEQENWDKNYKRLIEKDNFDMQMGTANYKLNLAKFEHDKEQDAINNNLALMRLKGGVSADGTNSDGSSDGQTQNGIKGIYSFDLSGQVDEKQGTKSMADFNAVYNQEVSSFNNNFKNGINQLTTAMGKQPLWLKTANGWAPNTAQYGSEKEVWRLTDQYRTEARNGTLNNNASPAARIFIDTINENIRSLQALNATRKTIQSQVDASLNSVTGVSKNVKNLATSDKPIQAMVLSESNGGLLGDMTTHGAYYDGKVANAQDVINFGIYKYSSGDAAAKAKEALIKKFGAVPGSMKGIGVDLALKDLKSNISVYQKIPKLITDVYNNNLEAISPNIHNVITTNSQAKDFADQTVVSIINQMNVSGKLGKDADAALKAISSKDDKQTNNVQYQYVSPYNGNGTGEIRVIKNGVVYPIKNVPTSLLTSMPGYKATTDFDRKFGPQVISNGLRGTDPNYPYSTTGTNRYNVQYYLNGDGQGRYMLMGTIKSKDNTINTPVIPLDPSGAYRSKSQIMELISTLNNDANVDLFLQNASLGNR